MSMSLISIRVIRGVTGRNWAHFASLGALQAAVEQIMRPQAFLGALEVHRGRFWCFYTITYDVSSLSAIYSAVESSSWSKLYRISSKWSPGAVRGRWDGDRNKHSDEAVVMRS